MLERPVIVVLASRSADANWKRKQLCKKLHILQKLSFLTTQTKGLASVQDGRAEWSYVEHGPLLSNFGRIPVAVVSSGAPLTSFCLVRDS